MIQLRHRVRFTDPIVDLPLSPGPTADHHSQAAAALAARIRVT